MGPRPGAARWRRWGELALLLSVCCPAAAERSVPASAGEQAGPSKGGWGGAAPNGHALSPKSYRLSAQEEFEEAFGALRGSSAESASERHGRFPLPNFSSDGSAEEAAEEVAEEAAEEVAEEAAEESESEEAPAEDWGDESDPWSDQ